MNLQLRPCLFFSLALGVSAAATTAQAATDSDIGQVVRTAFAETHQGWSSDEVLLQDALNRTYIARCQARLPDASIETLNWTLLNQRKAGKLNVSVTQRRHDRHDAIRHLAEIAARTVQDRHRVSIDRIMCNAKMRADFDEQGRLLCSNVDPYQLRKAAFSLRKNRRLRPELLLRIADWDRTITVHRAEDIARHLADIPDTPGIYIFRDDSGYLYVGESIDLRKRLAKHLDQSDRASLSAHLTKVGIAKVSVEIHAFPKASRAKQVTIRRAYESALIASRQPRFNVRP